ncbi:MAG TPA: VWA domain-containing protein [Candidatus Omnitrophota bacterium]|nr:VWA domain-containing protein [Candidatus Omnitrophota bacterium]HPS21099.1 VWA domain-containing protein [Candidatus Omnitrophota bacterium]
MRFGALYMASLLWILPVVMFFMIWAAKSRAKAVEKFADKQLIPEISGTFNPVGRKIKAFLILSAIAFILFAFIRPQWGFTWEVVKRQGLDILIAIDTSNSMLAEDVKPSRIERSKLAVRDLVKKLRGDRVGLIAFSGTAFLQCPLTVDYNGFLLSLDDIATDTIPVGGTSIANAIDTAINSYEGGGKKHKILIIITDGEDLEGGVDRAVQIAKSKGVTIYCVGIGTAEGELIPMREASGKMSFLKDENGTVVKTKLDENMLQKMALDTGGMYIRSTGAEFGLDLIYEQKLSKIEKEEFKSRMEKRYNDKFQIPLMIAFLLLLIEPLIGEKRNKEI